MKKIFLTVLIVILMFTFMPLQVLAAAEGDQCSIDPNTQISNCDSGLNCVNNICQSPFGQINVPSPIANVGFGAAGVSRFVNTGINLLYVAATIIFTFMILWSALQWIMSGGDKEKVTAARTRIMHAAIGILLLGVAFVFIKLFGGITGFHFFSGQ